MKRYQTNRSDSLISNLLLGIAALCFITFLIGGFEPNSMLAGFAVLALVFGCILLNRPGEAPILLFIFIFQWFQAAVGIFHSNWLGIEISEYSPISQELSTSTALTLCALVVLAIGMRLGAGPLNVTQDAQARALATSLPISGWTWLYAYAAIGGAMAGMVAWSIPSLAQIFLAIVNLRWAFFFMLAYASFVGTTTAGLYLRAAFLIELMQGIGGFFSDFKSVIFVTLMALIAANVRLTAKRGLTLAALLSLLLGLAVVWTAIKSDYRDFVSLGTGEQTVSVDFPARMAKLADLIGDLDAEDLAEGFDKLIRRLSFVEYLGAVVTHVPAIVPHSNGEIWFDAFVRPLTPRFLFPEKSIINDSERTMMYAGKSTANTENTSISLGYVAEAYIDFGFAGMMGAIFGFGLMLGSIQRIFQVWSKSQGLLGMAAATTILLSALDLGNSITKTIGGMGVLCLIVTVTMAYADRWLSPFMVRKDPRPRYGSDCALGNHPKAGS